MKLNVDDYEFMNLDEWDKFYYHDHGVVDLMRKMGNVTVQVWAVFDGEYGPYWTWKAYLYYMESGELVLREDCAKDTMEEAMRDAYHAIINSSIDDWVGWFDM